MMITSSICPIQLFQTRFQLHCRHRNFNSCCKEEYLNGNRYWNVFCAHFTIDPDPQSPVWCSDTNLKMFEGVRFRAIWTSQICKIYLLGTNHGGTSWVTKLMESMNQWPTTLSKFISTTVNINVSVPFINLCCFCL